MKNIIISIAFGLFGAAAFLLGAASSSGGNFVVFAAPAKLLQYAVFNWGLPLDDVQLNRWAVIVQFLGYFLISIAILSVINKLTKKHNKSFNQIGAKDAPPG